MKNESQSVIESILDYARWAPSGDNTQPWRFEIVNVNQFIVYGHDTREHCVYDLQGHASQLAIGALLESISIAASAVQRNAEFKLRENTPKTQPTIDVMLVEVPTLAPDALFPYLPIRSVQRRVLKTTPLSTGQKMALEQCVGDFYSIQWFEKWQDRLQVAFLMYRNGKLRLTLPEAFFTHSTVIEWNSRFSETKVPDQAVGLDSISTRLMQWAMKSWKRVKFLNNNMAGTLLPRIELDLLPGCCCAAHFILIAQKQPQNLQDYLSAGRAIQRFWLTATHLGLQLQPEMTPLIFSEYIRDEMKFTQETRLINFAEKLSGFFTDFVGSNNQKKMVFMGRIGQGKMASARSLRMPISQMKNNFHPK